MAHAYDLIPCDLLMFLPKFLCNQISRLPYNLQILDDRKTQYLVPGILLKSHICRELNDIIYRLQHMP